MSLVITPNKFKVAYITGKSTIKASLVRNDVVMDSLRPLAESSNVPGTYFADCPVEFEEGDDVIYYDDTIIIASGTYTKFGKWRQNTV
jgi:hypothetical protein